MNHTVINHGGTPEQVTCKFDFAFIELPNRAAVESAENYVEVSAKAQEDIFGVGNIFTIDKYDNAIVPRGKR